MRQLGIEGVGGSQLVHSQEEFEDLLQRIAALRRSEQQRHSHHQPMAMAALDGTLSPLHQRSGFRHNTIGSSIGSSSSDDDSDDVDHSMVPPEDLVIEKRRSRSNSGVFLKPVIVPGGSCVNTIKGLAMLGEKCGVLGKIGKDEHGAFYKENLRERGVIPLLTESATSRTGEVLCLVQPDGQRTMRAFLGASQEMNESDLLSQDFKGIKLLHVEGYSIYNRNLTVCAMQLAKRHNALVSFDLGSYELVRNFKPEVIDILRNYVDIVFANEEEANELIGGGGAEECVDYLSTLCHVAVVMMGPRGCLVRSKNEKYRCPTKPVTALDTTGAGDCFASGFLYAYLQGYSLEQCARLGALAGGTVVQYMGAEIPPSMWKDLKKKVNHMANHSEPFDCNNNAGNSFCGGAQTIESAGLAQGNVITANGNGMEPGATQQAYSYTPSPSISIRPRRK